jgi:hypothetical protein
VPWRQGEDESREEGKKRREKRMEEKRGDSMQCTRVKESKTPHDSDSISCFRICLTRYS